MNTDKEEMNETNGFTEVSFEIPDDLYKKALHQAREEGISLDEMVAALMRTEFARRPSSSIRAHP